MVRLSPVESVSGHSIERSDSISKLREPQLPVLVPVKLSIQKLNLSSVSVDSVLFQNIRKLKSEDLTLASFVQGSKSVE